TIGGGLRREQISRESLGDAGLIYPISQFTRLEGMLGVMNRDTISGNVQPLGLVKSTDGLGNPSMGNFPNIAQLQFNFIKGTSPFMEGTIVNDTTRFKSFGPWQGKRAALSIIASPYSSGQLGSFARYILDFRSYQRLTKRSLIAWRFVGDISSG